MQQPEGQRTSDQHKLHMEALQSLTSSYKTRLTSTLTLRDNYVLLCFFRDETVTLTHQPANDFFFFPDSEIKYFFVVIVFLFVGSGEGEFEHYEYGTDDLLMKLKIVFRSKLN